MRLTIVLGVILALLTASGASARSDSDSDSDRRHRVKQVEVMNLPDTQEVSGTVEVTGSVELTNPPEVQDVFVTNPTEGGRHTPFQLVGFTEATYQAGQTRFGFTRACQLEFPNSRMCRFAEVIETVQIDSATGLIGEAWVSPDLPDDNAFTTPPPDCGQWTSGQAPFSFPSSPFCVLNPEICSDQPGPSLGPTGFTVDQNGTSGSEFCSEHLPVACCAQVP